MNLFKNAAVMGDLHFGNKSNGIIHNEDCLNYIRWFIETAQDKNCETCIFLGDYFHNRNNTNLLTMNYGLQGLRLLGEAFDKIIMLVGNHDSYHKDKRSINSIAWAEHIPHVEIINEWTKKDNVIFVPWLVQDEYKQILGSSGDYLFGHLELPKFVMTAGITMPEVGELRASHFKNFGHVYSGHFHTRQTQNNITYIGNAFPHNYGDAGDDNRGMMILPYGQEPEFIAWPAAPKYRIVKISDLVIDPSKYLPEKGYIKLLLDTSITYEEAGYLKETLVEEYELREMSLVLVKKDLYADDLAPGGNIMFRSVDTIVQGQISDIKSETFDPNLLLEIYRGL